MRRIVVVIAAVLAMAFPRQAYAQRVGVADSVCMRDFIVPAALVGTGAFIHGIAHDSFDVPVRSAILGKDGMVLGTSADEYLRFIPAAMAVGLNFLDVPSMHGTRDILLETSMSLATVFIVGKGMKLLIDSPRPDGSDSRSFPSGHCALAFAGAELVRCEYGWKWGIAAYSAASAVAVLRLYNDAHWLSDVLAGAGIGILSAQLSRVLLRPVNRMLGLDVAVVPSVDPVSGAVCTSLAFVF